MLVEISKRPVLPQNLARVLFSILRDVGIYRTRQPIIYDHEEAADVLCNAAL